MIIFFYGEDDFRASKKIRELKDKFIREVDNAGNSLTEIDGRETNLKEINENVGSGSLLASKRMLVIKNIFSHKNKDILKDVLEYFKKKEEANDGNIIIFFDNSLKSKKKGAKIDIARVDSSGRDKVLTKKESVLFSFLSEQKFVQEFKKLSTRELSTWIKQQFNERGSDITIQASNELASLAGSDMWQIDTEIDKLINYKKGLLSKLNESDEKAQIDVEDVELLVKGHFDENIFALTDAISTRNKAQALKLLEEQYAAGLVDVYLITMITRQIKILMQIRSTLDNGLGPREIASALKIHPFIVQKGIGQASNFNLDTLKKIFNRLVDIDYKMKSGQGDAKTLLNILLSKI